MGRISDALSKLKLNNNAGSKPFGKMAAKDMINLFYHLAEVYDAEAILSEVAVKKKLAVFKNFARVNSLIHLLPSVKDMKTPKKCTRLVNSLLDMLEEKYGGDLYTRKSWPKACKELPKIEKSFSSAGAGAYNIDNLDLDPNAVPPGTSVVNEFPGATAVIPGGKVTKPLVESPAENGAKPKDTGVQNSTMTKASPIVSTAAGVDMSSHSMSAGRGHLPKENPTKNTSPDKTNSIKQPANSTSSTTMKRRLEPSGTSPGSKVTLKKIKTGHNASEQFIEALEDLSKGRPIVEVIGWSNAIFTNPRIWISIKNLILGRFGKELKKYNAKKVEAATGIQVTVEKPVSQIDIKILEVKLETVMKQIRNVVPDELSEEMKVAVNSSCENVKLRTRNANEW